MRRALPLLLSASLVALSLLVVGSPPALAAPDSCEFEDSTGVLTAHAGDPGYDYMLQRQLGSSRILFRNSDGVFDPCIDGSSGTRATVLNTDTIRFTGTDANDDLWISLANGRFAPGATPEGSGTSEIEIRVDMKDGTDRISLEGTSGDDTLRFLSGGILMNSDADQDVVTSGLEHRVAYGYAGNDDLSIGFPAPADLNGGEGSDRLTGNGADDVLYGDEGGDRLTAGAGADSLYGGDGSDQLYGGTDRDYLVPGYGDDTVDGGAEDDHVASEATADGADTVNGGPGDADEMSYYGRASKVVADLEGDGGDGSSGEGDRIGSDFEQLTGGLLGDRLTGNDANNTLYGYEGPDTLDGGDGDDYMRGGAGSDELTGGAGDEGMYGDEGSDSLSGGSGYDSLYGGTGDDDMSGGSGNDSFGEDSSANGADTMRGGTGNDSAYYSSRTAALSLTGDDSANDGESGEGDNIRSDVENLSGGSGADVLVGSAADQWLSGNGGADTLNGRDGEDTLYGYAGADGLTGGEGEDELYGGDDSDLLHSDDGAYDYVSCGNGADDATDNDSEDSLQADCELT